jgi:putative Holliday junction resolvase
MIKPLAQGRRLSFDFGERRIGVATSDAAAILVSPHATIINDDKLTLKLKDIFAEIKPLYVVIGNPIHLSGVESAMSRSAGEFAKKIKIFFSGPIYLVDERMSTQNAFAQMKELRKNSKETKSVIDQIAAVTILEAALQHEKAGQEIGILI